MSIRISILHATYFRNEGPEAVRRAWMESASQPERLEYLAAVTRTDTVALSQTEGWARIVVEPPDGTSTAVRNWNYLANIATGDLLFVIADDLFPRTEGWDDELSRIAKKHDPLKRPYVLKVDDSMEARDTKLRHPIVSRKFYSKFGMWNPAYSGVYVDSDFTLFTFWNASIVDARHICFNHLNPIVDNRIEKSLSWAEANTESESNRGKSVFEKRWPRFLRQTRISLIDGNTRSLLITSLRVKVFEAISIIFRSRFFNWIR